MQCLYFVNRKLPNINFNLISNKIGMELYYKVAEIYEYVLY